MTTPPHIGRLLGLDHGNQRIGLAVSDPLGITARELTILRRTSKAADFAALNRIAAEQRVVAIVIGLPENRDLPDGVYSQADTVRKWTDAFRATTPLPLLFWDEGMTSVEAQELSRQKKRRYDDPIDDLAARVILQSYLDALRDGLAEPPPLQE